MPDGRAHDDFTEALRPLLDCTLAMLALINPVSKLFIVSTLAPGIAAKQIRKLSVRSSLAALIILATFTLIGNPLLTHLFQVQIYSFKIAGGIALLYRGFLALDRGQFFEIKHQQKLAEMSIVPLASPLIAGPQPLPDRYRSRTVRYHHNPPGHRRGARNQSRCHAFRARPDIETQPPQHHGRLIRITGLIVATIGIQMVLDGVTDFVRTL
jgi:multiple antibiotic resistance protein